MTEILITIITAISSSGITGFFTWIFARRKYNSEVDGQWIINMKESLEFYKALSDDNKTRLDEVLAQNKSIIEQNKKLLSQNAALKLQVDQLSAKIDQLTSISCLDKTCKKRVPVVKTRKEDASEAK